MLTGTVLGIDYGDKRVGLAKATRDIPYARADTTLTYEHEEELISQIKEKCEAEQVKRIVLGLPLRSNGSETEQTRKTRAFAEQLTELLGIPVALEDERLTTKEVTRQMHRARKDERSMRGDKDRWAAQIILQSYLDRTHGTFTGN